MEKYAITKRFQYRTVRSNAIRPVIVVDGSHLRGPYNGTFVAASTMDGSGHIFPLAYGVIDSENEAAWTWFFVQLRVAYGERSDMILDTVEKVDVGVKEYLELAGYDRWRKCHAQVHWGWAMMSTIVESINVALVSARELLVFDSLEKVILMFGRWNHDNKHKATCTFTLLIGNFRIYW
ncbi:hypothetical protein RDI58_022485 [Solanum bulbocastanum]|uniref:MULE transposase domain-containing protein n=1 Tax=Solanum bulbocastanum TaxID=147425 RepID=A0AAN8T7V3_SOLBU